MDRGDGSKASAYKCPPRHTPARMPRCFCLPPPERLRAYIAEHMRMSPIDQPLML